MKAYAYTNIEQSKKLAEILPLESADMHYSKDFDGSWFVDFAKYTSVTIPKYVGNIEEHLLPCWSLAALLSILPPYLFEFERGIDLNVYPNLNGKGWHCSYMPNCTENVKKDNFKLMTSEDNLIDACYEMVLKLYEQNIL